MNTFKFGYNFLMFSKIFFLLILVLPIFSNGQETMTLEKCINYALENNISIQQNQLDLEQKNYQLLKDKLSLLPSASGFVSQGYTYGNSLDYTTYEYVKENTNSNYFSLSSDLTLFNGFRLQNNIRSSKFALEASNYSYKNIKDQISMNVVATYLQILMNIKQVKFAEDELALTDKLLDRAKLLVEVGQETKSKELELKAQLAASEVSIVEAQNNLNQSYLTLKKILNWDISKKLKIEEITLDIEKYQGITPKEIDGIVEESLLSLPNVKRAKANYESAKYAYKAAKGLLYPSLGLSSSVNTRYSSSTNILTGKTDPFNEQIENNFGQSLNFGLNIPIFNNLQNSSVVNNAEISMKNAKLNLDDEKIQARNKVYEAFYNMNNAQKNFQASKNNLNAQQLLFEQSEIKYKAEVINFYDWQSTINNLKKAQTSFLNSKFDYIYRIKIFDYYRGIPLKLN
ncbi:MAG: TolC family protein [Bacteroidota bacterium]|nr:TolC family protein [Bacteroidota bacterium]